uniref:Uncharacterized protein n=1 Tax=Papilio xuthus TaxID=66420 RepID=I4DJZ2_PAPXU|nr:unknown unsecreted protein [Papilio xuthus]
MSLSTFYRILYRFYFNTDRWSLLVWNGEASQNSRLIRFTVTFLIIIIKAKKIGILCVIFDVVFA